MPPLLAHPPHDLPDASAPDAVRVHLHWQGAVQGVGFRPLCAQVARQLDLNGWVRNDTAGLQCEVQGPAAAVQAFVERLRSAPPPLATITHFAQRAVATRHNEPGFQIQGSDAAGALHTGLPADTAPCEACLNDLFTPGDRRHRYAFINCTHCGPRFTITARLPYDRPHTSLAPFPLCAACEREYRNPLDRRFHAQPTACPTCGPRLSLRDARGELVACDDPLQAAAQLLRDGRVVAVKGVGGYHLVCDATQARPLQSLRSAKQRATKPFAVMVPNLASARRWVRTDAVGDAAGTEALLASPRRPILLLPCQPGVAAQHPLVAPGLNEWGVMLPTAPLHWLLLHELIGAPTGEAWREDAHEVCLAMTSANPGGEPLVIDEAEAIERLAGMADAYLMHDRAILGRCDDSVRRPMAQRDTTTGRQLFAPFVRRARGHVPDPIPLPGVDAHAPSVLAAGAWMKNTVCLTRGNEAFLSPHVGDLGSAASCQAWVEAVDRLTAFLGVQPNAVAHDLHPDFFSTRRAQQLATHWRVPALGVQHHHAHAAAVLAEHGHGGPALALVLDGVGLGTDGTAWGGELLHLRGSSTFERRAHLPLLQLAGGDRAAQEPWRVGAAMLHAVGRGADITQRYAHEPAAPTVQAMLARGLNCPPTSSAGRWFDGAAALLGLATHQTHEAAGAMALEAAAQAWVDAHGPADPWEDGHTLDPHGGLAFGGLIHQLAATSPSSDAAQGQRSAARFHATLAQALAAWVTHHARATHCATVALARGLPHQPPAAQPTGAGPAGPGD